jgi:hypothetical protein
MNDKQSTLELQCQVTRLEAALSQPSGIRHDEYLELRAARSRLADGDVDHTDTVRHELAIGEPPLSSAPRPVTRIAHHVKR